MLEQDGVRMVGFFTPVEKGRCLHQHRRPLPAPVRDIHLECLVALCQLVADQMDDGQGLGREPDGVEPFCPALPFFGFDAKMLRNRSLGCSGAAGEKLVEVGPLSDRADHQPDDEAVV